MTWQLSQNGTVISTQTTDSFVFGAISGTYTLTLTVTDAQGDTATASTTVSVVSASASASNFMVDRNTEGNWVGSYGTQGYDIMSDAVSLPSYATVDDLGRDVPTLLLRAAPIPEPSRVRAGPSELSPPGTRRPASRWMST